MNATDAQVYPGPGGTFRWTFSACGLCGCITQIKLNEAMIVDNAHLHAEWHLAEAARDGV